MSNAPEERPFKVRVGERIVACRSLEDRNLVYAANAIAEDPTAAEHMTIGRLHLIKDACQLYSHGKHQRLVKMAIDRKIAGGAR